MPPRYSREIEQPIVMGDSLKDQFRTSPCEASCPGGKPDPEDAVPCGKGALW